MAMSAITFRQIVPNGDVTVYAVTYSKTNVGDYWTVTADSAPTNPIKTLRFATMVDTGVEDPCTYSATVVTCTSGTGAGYGLMIGNC